jgi:hypothetical protein
VWSLASGFCFVTFTDHAAPVTGVAWLPSGNAVLSCSLVRSLLDCGCHFMHIGVVDVDAAPLVRLVNK